MAALPKLPTAMPRRRRDSIDDTSFESRHDVDVAREECLLGLNHAYARLYTDLTASPNETPHAHLLRGSAVLRFEFVCHSVLCEN